MKITKIKMKNKLLPLLSVGALLVASTPMASAVVLVDFGENATDPTLGGTWNTLADAGSGSGISLLDSGGIDSGIDLAFSNFQTTSTSNNTWSGGDKDWVDDVATSDYFWRGAGTATITLSGLDNGLTYNISLVSVRATSGSRVADITVGGAFTTDEVSSDDYDSFTGFGNRSILNWSGVTPTGGVIEISLAAGSGQSTFINAMQIAVPEPGTYATVAGALILGFVMFRSRRTK